MAEHAISERRADRLTGVTRSACRCEPPRWRDDVAGVRKRDLSPRTAAPRGFGAFLGPARARLAFVVDPAAVPEWFRGLSGGWPVSAVIALGATAYRNIAWIAATCTRLTRDAARLDAILRHRLAPAGDCPMLRLARCAPAPFDRLARVLSLPGSFDRAPDWLRVGLPGGDADFGRLDRG